MWALTFYAPRTQSIVHTSTREGYIMYLLHMMGLGGVSELILAFAGIVVGPYDFFLQIPLDPTQINPKFSLAGFKLGYGIYPSHKSEFRQPLKTWYYPKDIRELAVGVAETNELTLSGPTLYPHDLRRLLGDPAIGRLIINNPIFAMSCADVIHMATKSEIDLAIWIKNENPMRMKGWKNAIDAAPVTHHHHWQTKICPDYTMFRRPLA
jgi:hypothetical protein